jgi:hypothetical protein
MADSPRGLILWTIAMVALAIVVAWAIYLARQVLLLIYVSALLAIRSGPAACPAGWRSWWCTSPSSA